jgi:hypothetical protein
MYISFTPEKQLHQPLACFQKSLLKCTTYMMNDTHVRSVLHWEMYWYKQGSIRWNMQLYVVCVCADRWSYTCRLDNEVIILVWSFSEVSILSCKNDHQYYKLIHIHTLMHTLNNDEQEGCNFCVKWNWCLVPWLINTMSLKLRLDMWYTYSAITDNCKISENFLQNQIFAAGKIWYIPAIKMQETNERKWLFKTYV